MTFTEIKAGMAAAGKPVSEVQLYRYLRRYELTPVTKQKPQRYRDDAVQIIMDRLNGNGLSGLPESASDKAVVAKAKHFRTVFPNGTGHGAPQLPSIQKIKRTGRLAITAIKAFKDAKAGKLVSLATLKRLRAASRKARAAK